MVVEGLGGNGGLKMGQNQTGEDDNELTGGGETKIMVYVVRPLEGFFNCVIEYQS